MLARMLVPLGIALSPVRPVSLNAVVEIGMPNTSFLTVDPELRLIVLVLSENLNCCVE